MNKMIQKLEQNLKYRLLLMLFLWFALCGLWAQTTFEGFESIGFSGIPWSTNTPNNQWNVSYWEPFAGGSSFISGGFSHNSVSNLNLNINVLTAGDISFYMKTDTEYWGAVFGDFLKFYIDGVLQGEWAGSIGWTLRTYPVSVGVHNLSWSFTRDYTDQGWDGWKWNRAWIDNVSFPANTFFMGSGDGSAGNPYQISTAEQLNSIRNYLGNTYSGIHFKIMNDIDLSAYLAEGGAGYLAWGGAGWMPMGTDSVPFLAHLDGNYKTVSELAINRPSYADCGFFGFTGPTALLENLSLVSGAANTVQGGNAAAMLVGRNNGFINNCSAAGAVRGSLWNGGLVGWNNGTLNRCSSSGDVESTGNTVGGLVGQNNGYINKSYSRASARGNDYIGGLVGYQTQSGAPGIAECFATGAVTNFGNPSTRGGLLGYLTAGSVSNSYWDVQSTGMMTSYGSANTYGKTSSAMKTQSTFSGWDFAGESVNGTADYWFISSTFNDAYPYLVWQQTGTSTPVMPHIQVSTGSLAFGNQYINTSTVQTFTIANTGQLPLSGTINSPEYYALATSGSGRNTISFDLAPGASEHFSLCFMPLAYGTYNGSVVISSNSETQSTFNLAVTGICIPVPEVFAGGSGTQEDPWLISTPGQLSRLNDFLGTANNDKYFKIINDMDMTEYFLPGNPGYNYGYYWKPIGRASGLDNQFRAKVDGNHCTIYGFKANHLQNTNNESNIGLFGYTGAGFELTNLNLQVSGVAGWHQVGGLVGCNYGLINNCHVSTTTTGEIVGLFGIYCGGLVGINGGSISKCSFRGNVHGTVKVGGLLGAGGNVSDSFATGSVIGYDKVGGFVGAAGSPYQTQFTNCYAAVQMEYSSESSILAGGFVAEVVNVGFTSCYWDRELSNLNTSAGLNSSFGKSTAEMQSTSTYVGWDMSYIWEHLANQNGAYPQIRLAPATMVFNHPEVQTELLVGTDASRNLTITNTGAQTLYVTGTVEYLSRETQTILAEGFEHGGAIPDGWTQEHISGDNVNWTFRRGSPGLPNNAHDGNYNANLIDGDAEDDKTMLVSPALNLAGISYSPQLSFYYFMQPLPYASDELSVYYRSSATGAWTLLKTMEYNNMWAVCTIALPNPSSDYYIGFEGNARAAWGISIDDVTVSGAPIGHTDSWLSLNHQSATSSVVSSRQTASWSLGFHAQNLAAGTYHARIQFSSNAYNNWSPVIPVSLEVGYGDNPQISLSSTGFSFGEQLAGSSSTQSFRLENIGGARLDGTILLPDGYTVGQSRGQRNLLSFTIAEAGSQDFDLNFVPSVAGTYDGNIVINSNSLSNESISLPVSGLAYTNPSIAIDTDQMQARLAAGETSSQSFTIENTGSRPLAYSISITEPLRPLNGARNQNERSISGSTLTLNQAQYTPGTTQDWIFALHNAGFDSEWLKYVQLDFPEGVIVNSVSNFVGGSGGDLIPNFTSGNGITIMWSVYDSNGWGVVLDGESAVATVNISIPANTIENLILPYQIFGDIWGAEPHTVSGEISLVANLPSVSWFHTDSVSGTIAGNSSIPVFGHFSAEGLEPGLYEALMTINSNDPIAPTRTIAIAMEVTGPVPTLRIGRDGSTVFLDWDAVSNATSYRIYRSGTTDGVFDLINETETLSFSEESTLAAAFYIVRAVFP